MRLIWIKSLFVDNMLLVIFPVYALSPTSVGVHVKQESDDTYVFQPRAKLRTNGHFTPFMQNRNENSSCATTPLEQDENDNTIEPTTKTFLTPGGATRPTQLAMGTQGGKSCYILYKKSTGPSEWSGGWTPYTRNDIWHVIV
jgi:hypothetical protein